MRKKTKAVSAFLLAFTLLLTSAFISPGFLIKTEAASGGYYFGDADFDGEVTAADARIILRESVKLNDNKVKKNGETLVNVNETMTVSMAGYTTICDIDKDHTISAADARLALRISVKLDKTSKTDVQYNPAEKPVLVMGTSIGFPPYEFIDDYGNYAGIDIEIADAVADKLGMTLEVRDWDFDYLVSAVAVGAVDVVLAGLTATEERKEYVDFSDIYYTNRQVILVPEWSYIRSVDDLDRCTIGVQRNTTAELYCTVDYGYENVCIYNNIDLAAWDLSNGQIDCIVTDYPTAGKLLSANSTLVMLKTDYIRESYAALFAKNNTELRDRFNEALAELKADGTIQAIVRKYIVS